MVKGLEDTFNLITGLQESRTTAELCDRFTAFTGRYGLSCMMAGTSPPRRGHGKTEAKHLLAWSYPTEWMEHYLRRRYAFVDPIIHRLEADLSSFRWAEAVSSVPTTSKSQALRMMNEAAEFNLRDGFVVPLMTLDGSIAAVSLAGERVDIPPKDYSALNFAASYAMARAIELNNESPIDFHATLTPRELECLKWIAEGKSEWEIGLIMCISEHTADKHLSNARKKLRAVSGAQAVARAIRLGLIH